jgi:hypothetical protein
MPHVNFFSVVTIQRSIPGANGCHSAVAMPVSIAQINPVRKIIPDDLFP